MTEAERLTRAYARGLALVARAARDDLVAAGIPAQRLAAVAEVYEQAAQGEPVSEPTA